MSDLFRRTAWALALASTLFIAACDDDDDNGTNNPSPVTSPSPTQSASPSPSPSASPSPNNNNQAGQTVSFLGIARQVDEGSGTLRVGGRRVDVNSATTIQNMGGQTLRLSQLQGQTVRVRGRAFDDGSVLAERITLQDQNNNDDDDNDGNNNQ